MAEFALTVQELLDSGLRRVGSTTGASAPELGIAIEEMNKAIRMLCMSHRNWRWLRRETTIATVADTKSISLPADCMAVNEIWYLSGGQVHDLDLLVTSKARRDFPNDASTGAPCAYVTGVYDNSTLTTPPIQTLDIKPTPDAVYTLNINYQAFIKKYTSSELAEVIPIPQEAQGALEDFFQSRMLQERKFSRSEIATSLESGMFMARQASIVDEKKNKKSQGFRLTPAVEQYRRKRYRT